MKHKKTNKIITLSVIGIIATVAIIIFALNFTGDNSKLSLLEKKWISDNTNTVINISVFNDIPIYGNGGSGIIFDFLDDFTKEYNIEFNKVSYYSSSSDTGYENIAFKVLNNDEQVSDNQILFYNDTYVLLASNEENTINNINDLLDNSNYGVLTNDYANIVYHLSLDENNVITYEDIESLIEAYNNADINYLVLPQAMYMDKIIKNELNIIYHISDISLKYVLEINDDSLYSIMNKYYIEFNDNYYDESYSKNFLDIFFSNSNYTDADRVNYNSSIYTYGYVVDMPYENSSSNNYVGIISNYLKEFQNIANVELRIEKYDNIEELKTSLITGDIDFAFCNFDTASLGSSFIYSNNIIDFNYVIISKNYINIRDITSLKGHKISVIGNSRLDSLLKDKSIETTGYINSDELMRSIDEESIIAMDKNMYEYYKDGKLKQYTIDYEGTSTGYNFAISSKNIVFANLFTNYLSMKDYRDIKYNYNTTIGINDNKALEIFSIIAFCIIVTILLFLITLLVMNKRKKNNNKKLSDDKIKYIDVMTSLKNRNYLNYSIPKWDENVIYPQTIIVIDLNNIKSINDNYGHNAGDEVIKRAANILIANQLEKTDLIRTDGNEFLIYMVGYEKEDVVAYAKKIYKEFKELPYGYGGSLGYSMIEDDVKTIDDAINEAIIDMHKNKDNEKK